MIFAPYTNHNHIPVKMIVTDFQFAPYWLRQKFENLFLKIVLNEVGLKLGDHEYIDIAP